MQSLQSSIALFLVIISRIHSANIIALFPFEAKSHSLFNNAIVRELLAAGHYITYITSVPSSEPHPHCTIVDFRFGSQEKLVTVSLSKTVTQFQLTKNVLDVHGEKFCYASNMRKTLAHLKSLNITFDLLIIPSFFMVDCFLPISEEFDIPVIGVITSRSYENTDRQIGNLRNPAITPSDFTSFYIGNTFWHRMLNSFNQLVQLMVFSLYESASQDDRFRRNFPHFGEKQKSKLSLVFFNNHPCILPRNMAPNSIDIAGVHISPVASALPQVIEDFIESSNESVILFSIGTMMRSSELKSKAKFLKVFASLPERVIWKTDEEIENLPKNVLTMKWLPQRDILAHRNVKAFITHCGIFGIQEAIFEGKPLIMIPFHSDQPGNAALMHQKGVGIYLHQQNLTEQNLLAAIRDVIDDKKYREKMQDLSRIFRDRPLTPQRTLIYWTEYVIRHKGTLHLRSATVEMPFYQFFLLDFISLVFFISAISLLFTFICLKTVYQNMLLKYEFKR